MFILKKFFISAHTINLKCSFGANILWVLHHTFLLKFGLYFFHYVAPKSACKSAPLLMQLICRRVFPAGRACVHLHFYVLGFYWIRLRAQIKNRTDPSLFLFVFEANSSQLGQHIKITYLLKKNNNKKMLLFFF